MPTIIDLNRFMATNDKAFFKALGTRIAQYRKEQGLSQQALADELGIAQQTLAHYEVGRARMQVSLLPKMAKCLGIAVDDLLGIKNGTGKRGPVSMLHRKIDQVSTLPRSKQKFITEMLDALIKQQQSA